jgi:hypothetical protein
VPHGKVADDGTRVEYALTQARAADLRLCEIHPVGHATTKFIQRLGAIVRRQRPLLLNPLQGLLDELAAAEKALVKGPFLPPIGS